GRPGRPAPAPACPGRSPRCRPPPDRPPCRRSCRWRRMPAATPPSASARAAATPPGRPVRRTARPGGGWPSWPPNWRRWPRTIRPARPWRRRRRSPGGVPGPRTVRNSAGRQGCDRWRSPGLAYARPGPAAERAGHRFGGTDACRTELPRWQIHTGLSKLGGMRRILASSIGVTCAAALALPLAPPAAAAVRGAPAAAAGTNASAPAAEPGGVPGSTQSLPLNPLTRDRATGAVVLGLAPRTVRHFSMLGVVWDDADAELHGRVQVRTRAAGTGTWSGWRDVETHNADHAADPGSEERVSGRVRGATAPLWVGESDGV